MGLEEYRNQYPRREKEDRDKDSTGGPGAPRGGEAHAQVTGGAPPGPLPSWNT